MNIVFAKQAEKSIGRLDAPTKQRIKLSIQKLPEGDIKRLKACVGLYRLRVGDWRILFTMMDGVIYIDDVLPRGGAYK